MCVHGQNPMLASDSITAMNVVALKTVFEIMYQLTISFLSNNHKLQGRGTMRAVNQMLTEVDGIGSRKDIFLLGATNRPDIIHPALLRSDRFGKLLYVTLPKPSDRAAILRVLTRVITGPMFHTEFPLLYFIIF